MSKKRKTRKQKEKAQVRRDLHVESAKTKNTEKIAPVSYSVKDIKVKPKKTEVKDEEKHFENLPQFQYLKGDIKTIAIATGLILSFDVLLFALLYSNILNLGFLGY